MQSESKQLLSLCYHWISHRCNSDE